jgi:putative DNA primase/helicase
VKERWGMTVESTPVPTSAGGGTDAGGDVASPTSTRPPIKKILEEETEEEKERSKKEHLMNRYEVFELNNKGERTNKIICPNLAKLLLNGDGNKFIITKDNQEIYLFNGSYYEPNGETVLRQRVGYYLDIFTTEYIKNEVLGYIKNSNYTDRALLNPPLNLLNFKNGVYNFETKEFMPHSPEFYFLYEFPVKFDVSKKSEKWEKFIDDITYPEDKNFLQEFAGFLFYRKYVWAILVILLGHGRNGKSIFIRVITNILGKENIEQIPLHILANDNVAKVKLFGKHGNLCADLGFHEVKHTGILKQLTGRDLIYARALYKPPFSFENFAKLMFACNTLPEIKDNTLAMIERLAVIEFPNTFVKGSEDCDPFLYEKLTTEEELSGILNWMLEGLDRLLKNKNFSTCRDFKNVLEYKKQCLDPVYQYINDRLEPDVNSVLPKPDVHKDYKEFCETKKYPVLNDVWFSRKMNQFLPPDWNVTSGQSTKHNWKGIKFKDMPVSQTGLDIQSNFIPKDVKTERIEECLKKDENTNK